MKKIIIILSTACILFTSCKDADRAQFFAMGKQHIITQYSGGKVINRWISTGNVSNEKQSDGWYFEDKETHNLIEVTGTICIEVLSDNHNHNGLPVNIDIDSNYYKNHM